MNKMFRKLSLMALSLAFIGSTVLSSVNATSGVTEYTESEYVAPAIVEAKVVEEAAAIESETATTETAEITPEMLAEEEDNGELEQALLQPETASVSMASVLQEQSTVASKAPTSQEYFNITYDDINNTAEIKSYISAGGRDVVIPNHVTKDGKQYRVTSIAPFAFLEKNLYSVVIPDTITHIKQDAFKRNNNLKKVIFENADAELSGSIRGLKLDRAIFYWCYGMNSIVLPKRLVSIDHTTFSRSTIQTVTYTSTNAPVFTGNQGFPQYKANVKNINVPAGQLLAYKNAMGNNFNGIKRSNNYSINFTDGTDTMYFNIDNQTWR